MPEIAEVERARTILDQILVGQTIIDVESVPLTLRSSANPSLMIQLYSKTQRPRRLQPPSKAEKSSPQNDGESISGTPYSRIT